jgi:hypothetical protein
MNNHKATPEQWKADKYDWSKADTEAMTGDSAFRCILELQARVVALEAQAGNYPAIPDSSTPPPVATDEDLGKTYRNSVGCNLDRYRAIYNLGVAHGQASSREVAEPAPVAGVLARRIGYELSQIRRSIEGPAND